MSIGRRKFLTVSQAAAELGIHVDTLRAWTRRGWIEATILPSGHRRYSWAEIDRIRQEGKAAAAA